jgi:outer membrane autotransporter protein
MDMYMLMTSKERQALKLRNKYAAADSHLVFDPTASEYDTLGAWVRPYSTFEKVNLRGGPKVSNVAYGSFFGGESELYDLGNGWDGMYGVYVGYNGSHQAYDGISIYQNGGTLGAVGMAYKGNFFTGLTINVGANAGEASTAYGNDNFSMLMAGIASKTGYNFEFADGKFIIQPSFQISYSFVDTFNYTNAAGARITSSPLNAIQIEPGIKFIGNLKNGWQPYAGVSVIGTIMDKTNFDANDISLPELSIKPYVRYGLGVRKRWGERLSGFGQAFINNGGRNGIGLQAGFRWAIGEGSTGSTKGSVPELKKTQIKLSNGR